MKNIIIIILALALIAGVVVFFTHKKKDVVLVPPTLVETQYKDLVHVDAPLQGAKISSPLVVKGKARGNWYFEASFPVKLLDGNGNQIAVKAAQASEDWMTSEYVPFSVTLTFAKPATPTGTLILQKDNPSGLPENEDSVSIPVTF